MGNIEDKPPLRFATLNAPQERLPYFWRAKVLGGWLVWAEAQVNVGTGVGVVSGLTFVPDPDHEWDGGSLP